MKHAFKFGTGVLVAGGLLDTFGPHGLSSSVLILFGVVSLGLLVCFGISSVDMPVTSSADIDTALLLIRSRLDEVNGWVRNLQQQGETTQQGVATVQQTLSFIITKAKLDQLP